MDSYTSVPTEIEAIQWTGDNAEDIGAALPDGVVYFTFSTDPDEDTICQVLAGANGAQGLVPVPIGHWIVRNPGDDTDYWPIDPDAFTRKYVPTA